MKKEIDTMSGVAKYVCTEVEDSNGRWNDSYTVRDGYYVIHEGNKHHVYKLNYEKKTYLRLLNEQKPETALFRKDRNAWLKEMKKRDRMTLAELIKNYKLKERK